MSIKENDKKYIAMEALEKYLVNELIIEAKNIEKCPSILYLNIYSIKENVNFEFELKDKEFTKSFIFFRNIKFSTFFNFIKIFFSFFFIIINISSNYKNNEI